MKQAKKAVISKEIIRRLITIFIIIGAVLLGYNLNSIGVAYLLGFTAYLLVMIAWIINNILRAEKSSAPASISIREYVLFSLPLLFSFILKQLGGQMNIFFIGYFKDTREIGLYSAALSFAKLTSLALDIILFMFVPTITELSARQQDDEIKRIMRIVSSVLFVSSSILLASFLLIPKLIMKISFGGNFVEAYMGLSVLSIAYFFYANCGLSGAVLICFGETRKYFIADFLSVMACLIVVPILVKNYGFIGACYAVLVRMIVLNSLWMAFAYRTAKILPMTSEIFFSSMIAVGLVICYKMFSNSESVFVLILYVVSVSVLTWRLLRPLIKELSLFITRRVSL
jgi:O-antigen/teichoic acid export membrane protein